jgi:protein phosphatase
MVVRFGRALQTLLTNLPEGLVPDQFEEMGYGMVVADGMGGRAAGEIASQLAISTLVALVLDTPDWILGASKPEADRVLQRMTERYQRVDAVLNEQAVLDPSRSGMGTTMTLACSLGYQLILAHLGDSRIYLLREGALQQITRDHTVAQAMVDFGILPRDEAATHRLRHVLTRVLGRGKDQAEPEVQRLRLVDQDQLLLCTDGLTDMVANGTIESVLQEAATADQACQMLVELALKEGGKDNVTVVLARYRFAPQA